MIERVHQGMLTAKQVAKMLGMSPISIAKFCRLGSIKAINVSPSTKKGAWRIPPQEIEKLTGMRVEWDENDLPRLVYIG